MIRFFFAFNFFLIIIIKMIINLLMKTMPWHTHRVQMARALSRSPRRRSSTASAWWHAHFSSQVALSCTSQRLSTATNGASRGEFVSAYSFSSAVSISWKYEIRSLCHLHSALPVYWVIWVKTILASFFFFFREGIFLYSRPCMSWKTIFSVVIGSLCWTRREGRSRQTPLYVIVHI